MGRFGAALIVVGFACAALADESNIRDLEFVTNDLKLETTDLVFTVEDLVRVTDTPEEVRIELPADILFDFDKSDIRAAAQPALADTARIIREQAKADVRIEGHTDSKGSAEYNQGLSEQRASSVKSWLVEKEKLDKVGFTTTGLGATKPVAPNELPDGRDNPAGRQKNRRVEIVIERGSG
jgi:outer membrane protein OmpA-like peptidoglycan-associated protein